jgi:Tol biopolymer transport system component
VGISGAEPDGESGHLAISGDGRFVAFESRATNLVGGDTNGQQDIFVRDRLLAVTERVSVGASGQEANGPSRWPALSTDGRYVAFASQANNLVGGGDTNNAWDVFVRDRQVGTTERVSVYGVAGQGNADSGSGAWGGGTYHAIAISGDGRYVAFSSAATNLVSGDTNGVTDVFVRDRLAASTERVGEAAITPALNGDGRYVAFASCWPLVSDDTNSLWDVYVRDRETSAVERISVSTRSGQGNANSFVPSVSSDGRYVAFESYADNLVGGDTNAACDVFLRDRTMATTTLVSVGMGGQQANGNSQNYPSSVSDHARYVALTSVATNLVGDDTNSSPDVFVRDRATGTTERASVDSVCQQGNDWSTSGAISGDGRYVAFGSSASNLGPPDTNGYRDIFVRDRWSGGSCGGQNVVLFIQGIASESHCGDWDENDPTKYKNYKQVSWLRDYLSVGWPHTMTGLDPEHFLYYDYTTHGDSPATCSGKPIPDYDSADACWSLDDKYKLVFERDAEGGGEARRLATYLHNYLADPAHQGARISIIAHSQGGVLAAYVVASEDFGSSPATPNPLTESDRARINAIVTLDSPLGGVPHGGGLLYEWNHPCVDGPDYDSAPDMASTGPLIARLHNPPYPSVRLFTVDADPGNWCLGPMCYTVADDDHSQAKEWQQAHLSVAAPNHGDVWTGELEPVEGVELRRFVLCAVAGLSPGSECSNFAQGINVSVSPGQVVFRSRLVPAYLAKLTTLTVWPGSTIGTTLVSPTGRRIDANTVADDVTHVSTDTSEWFEVASPEAGEWTVEFLGADVPPEGETATFSTLAIPDPASDLDGDLVADDVDNCPGASNANQSDIDQDGLGDACDDDDDGDAVADGIDNCPLTANPGQEDSDGNSLGDACDPGGVDDADLDGLVDNLDNCPLHSNSDQVNTDDDAWGDACDTDDDNDGALDGADNCPLVSNPGQQNTDAAIDNGPGVPGDDTTIPNAVTDSEGDACETDGDVDNDGLPDAQDTNPLGATGLCAAFAGASDGHSNPAGGDVTNDDDHDGNPAPVMGTDASDNGPSWDTDGDGALDGVECTLGHNPRDRTDRPTTAECGGTGDTDGDGLLDAWETCKWGTDPTKVDTDGDTVGDCVEAADVDGNTLVNFVGDTIYYARAALLPPASFGKTMDFDIDKNGLVNFVGDVIFEARFGLIPGLCK